MNNDNKNTQKNTHKTANNEKGIQVEGYRSLWKQVLSFSPSQLCLTADTSVHRPLYQWATKQFDSDESAPEKFHLLNSRIAVGFSG